MDYTRSYELQYRIEHRHSDGSSSTMVEQRSHHDPADHDPERSWGVRRLFRCEGCDESVIIEPGPAGDAAAER